MNTGIKTGVVTVLVFAAGLMTGYYAGVNNITIEDAVTKLEETTTQETSKVTPPPNDTTREKSAVENESVPQETTGVTKVDTSQLTPGQKQLLETLGVDTENLVITPAMIACAEAKVGAARVAEIQNGATPTFMEGASLMACYSN